MKKIRVLLIALLLICAGAFASKSYAAERSLGANLIRPFTNSKYQFRVEGLTANNEPTDILYTIVKIYDSADKDESAKILYSKALYCLRGGVGFGANEVSDISTSPITYSEFGEMHKDARNVINKYNDYYGINLDRTENINGKNVNIYNAILWILDEAYLPVDSENYSEAEYKTELLDKAGIIKIQQEEITKDDIEVIQQLAIWYFTNYDEQKSGVKPTVSQSTAYVANMLSKNGNNDFGRISNLNKLYQYFINGAVSNEASYITDQQTGEKIKNVQENKFDHGLNLEIKSVDYKEPEPGIITPEGYYYEIGPFSIKSNTGARIGEEKIDLTDIIIYDANGKAINHYYEFSEGKAYNIIEFYDSNNNRVQKIEKGINYYARVYKMFTKGSDLRGPMSEEDKYDLSNVTLKISSSYTLSKATFLIRENADQPVVEINKEKVFEGDEITTVAPKEFDLSLRKFITNIKRGETNLEITSRVPRNKYKYINKWN